MKDKFSRRFVFVFHRVSGEKSTQDNPFNFLSNITPRQFEMFIKFLKLKAKFTDLDSLFSRDENRKMRLILHFTFDDVSASFVDNALAIVEKYRIPVTIFPSAKNAEEGYTWRDKIYFILNSTERLGLFVKKAEAAFAKEVALDKKNIYEWSKSPEFQQGKRGLKVIDEVMEKYVDEFEETVEKYKPYLNWGKLKSLSSHPLVTIGNHGFSHCDYNTIPEEEVTQDISKSHDFIEKRLGIKCTHFAVPFGSFNQSIFSTTNRILCDLGYKTVGWEKRVSNIFRQEQPLFHYFRIDSGPNSFVNLVKLFKAYLKTQHIPVTGTDASSC
jgi:peptidoglycan/xylan/chitin deacetylase (PgdA/CDA1 family)